MPQVCQVQGISLLGSRALLQRSRRAPRAASPSRGDGDDRRSQFCRPTLQKGWRPPTSSIGSAVFFSCDPKKYGFDTALRVTARSSWLAVKTIGHQGSGARACSAWLPMHNNVTNRNTIPRDAVATEAEIADAAERLGLKRDLSAPAHHRAGTSHVHQTLRRGRSHVVTVEIKPSRSRHIAHRARSV